MTATSGTGESGLVLANYVRQEGSEPTYRFEFPHFLQIWEAASATSAAPSFFKPFKKLWPPKTYLDGALYHNNPARVAENERKLLWPDVAENPPDIFLSVGTGKYGQRLEEQIAEFDPLPDRQQHAKRPSISGTVAKPKQDSKKSKWGGSYRFITKHFSVLVSVCSCFRTSKLYLLDTETSD